MNKLLMLAATASALTFNAAPPQVLAQFEEDAPKKIINYTNMSIADLDLAYDSAEKEFNDAFKVASDKLNKTKKYDEPSISALVKSEGKLSVMIEGYRSNLAASGKIQDKKYSIADLSNLSASEPLSKYIDALKNA